MSWLYTGVGLGCGTHAFTYLVTLPFVVGVGGEGDDILSIELFFSFVCVVEMCKQKMEKLLLFFFFLWELA